MRQHHVEQPDRSRLVEGVVAVAALGRLDAGGAPVAARAGRDRVTGGPQPDGAETEPTLGEPGGFERQRCKNGIAVIVFEQVDLFGFSMGGMIAQEIVLMEPRLVRRMIITGTGPAGGEGISKVARVTYLDMIRGWLTFQDPKQFLFFTRTPGGIRAGKEFLARLNERSQNRDKKITVTALQAQLKALRRWGSKKPADLSKIHQPVLVANGESDRMVPSKNTYDLARRLPNSDLIIYPDAGHGGVFQFHADFVPKALEFLAR